MTDLLEATVRVYEVFRGYALRAKIECCPHCELDDDERKLHTKPLAELTWDELHLYLWKAITTFGETADFKHFLPRLLELHVATKGGDTRILFSKLDCAEWRTWPAVEIEALRMFVGAWWRELERRGVAFAQEFADELDDDDGEYWELAELRAGTDFIRLFDAQV